MSFCCLGGGASFADEMETPAPLRLKDALDLMEAAPEFAIRFVKADRRRKTAGEIEVLSKVRLATRRLSRTPQTAAPDVPTRRPHHYAHATRNLADLRTGRLVKAHIYLILDINGRPVLI